MPYKKTSELISGCSSKGGASSWKVPQKIYRPKFLGNQRFWVRVKTRGKSTRTEAAMPLLGKPHPEQDKISELSRLFISVRGYVA